jgi:hypothetical protein
MSEPHRRISPKGAEYTFYPRGSNTICVRENRRGVAKQMTFPHSWEKLNQSWFNWEIGAQLIQHAFPYLTASEREFLLTGLLPAEFDELREEESL